MKIKKATMRAIDRRGSTLRGEHAAEVTLKGDIHLVLTTDRDGAPTAQIRRYITDADLAEQRGHESGDNAVLMDWFELVDVRVMFYDATMTLTGYMEGTNGRTRNGETVARESGTGTLTRTEWTLR